VPDPAGRFESDAVAPAQDHRSGFAGIHCHSIAAPARQHPGR
jgi:hypothetical protein